MILVRDCEITITPLTNFEIGGVYNSVVQLGTCKPTIKVLLPENFPHLVRVVMVVVHRYIPDATMDEVSAALNPDNLTAVLLALSSGKPTTYIHPESGHGQ
jgi:hypothetical protein